MVADEEHRPFLVLERTLVPWHPCGYSLPIARSEAVAFRVLTPRSVVQALAHGYPVEFHASARAEESLELSEGVGD